MIKLPLPPRGVVHTIRPLQKIKHASSVSCQRSQTDVPAGRHSCLEHLLVYEHLALVRKRMPPLYVPFYQQYEYSSPCSSTEHSTSYSSSSTAVEHWSTTPRLRRIMAESRTRLLSVWTPFSSSRDRKRGEDRAIAILRNSPRTHPAPCRSRWHYGRPHHLVPKLVLIPEGSSLACDRLVGSAAA